MRRSRVWTPATSLRYATPARDADIVVNCVGPYIISGYDIAATVVHAARHYVDFAFEQFHYNRLRTLDTLARRERRHTRHRGG